MPSIYVASDNHSSILGERVATPINHPFSEKFLALFEAMNEVRSTAKALAKAVERDQNRYTGQYSSDYFYQQEQDSYNRSVNAASEVLMVLLTERGGNVYSYTPFRDFMDRLIDWPKLTDKERVLMDGMVYIGDLIMAVENDPKLTQGALYRGLSPATKKLFQKIPLRQGTEVWVRPGSES